jgi:hypothetical protein
MQKSDPELTVINFIGNDLLNLEEIKFQVHISLQSKVVTIRTHRFNMQSSVFYWQNLFVLYDSQY